MIIRFTARLRLVSQRFFYAWCDKTTSWLDRGHWGTGPSRPRFGRTRLSGPQRNVGSSIPLRRAWQACPSDSSLGGTCLSGPRNNVCQSIDRL